MQKLYATTAEKGWKGNEISHWLANSHIDLQLRFCKPTNYIGKNCTIKTMFKREQQMHLNISTLKTSIKTKKHEIINQQNIGQYRSGHLIRPSRPSVFFFCCAWITLGAVPNMAMFSTSIRSARACLPVKGWSKKESWAIWRTPWFHLLFSCYFGLVSISRHFRSGLHLDTQLHVEGRWPPTQSPSGRSAFPALLAKADHAPVQKRVRFL